MIRTILCTTALFIAAPALAQSADPAATPASPAQAAQLSAAQPAAATQVAAIVDSEFPAYDADKNGQLEQTEFAKWMVALKDQEMKATGKAIPAAEVAAWAGGAFVSADTDKSAAVTKPELVTYLSGGAG